MSGITFARPNTCDPYSICASKAARSLSFVNACTFDVTRRARPEVDIGGPTEVGERDDRRHRAATVAEPLIELQRALEQGEGLADHRRDRELHRDVFEHLAGRHALRDRDVQPELDLL